MPETLLEEPINGSEVSPEEADEEKLIRDARAEEVGQIKDQIDSACQAKREQTGRRAVRHDVAMELMPGLVEGIVNRLKEGIRNDDPKAEQLLRAAVKDFWLQNV